MKSPTESANGSYKYGNEGNGVNFIDGRKNASVTFVPFVDITAGNDTLIIHESMKS